MPETLVPDTSVLVDGRITQLVRSEYAGARVLVPYAALAELEAQANRGLETGFTGLDELTALQTMQKNGEATVAFVGRRPSADEVERAATGTIDALIREAAQDSEGIFVTSDRVQAHAAAAQGLRHHYLRPIVEEPPDFAHLRLWPYFGEDVTSVHLKSDCVPMVKRGKPGEVRYEPARPEGRPMAHQEVRAIARECIEFAKRDYNSFIELQRHGCTVIQLGPMRITIAQPPFSDGLEVTAVRPIFKATLDDYDLPPHVLERVEGKARGVFVAGPPGSGKSTFAAAVAEHLHGMDRVVKTMEQPRDLQVPKEITQYGALDKDMAWTGEVLLLVRPDHVIFDEVRTTGDYHVFADMRLAGVGLFGVTHANRAIDAVQRLIGRVDLGMIPQVVDTIVFIDDGRIQQILELEFTVRVPTGMMQEDLARPVVVVKDFEAGREVYELYTFGEQIVVMPLEGAGAPARRGTAATRGANAAEIRRALSRFARGHLEVEAQGGRATVYAEETEIPGIIGKGGRTVQMLERRLGVRLDIKPLHMAPVGGGWREAEPEDEAVGRRGRGGRSRTDRADEGADDGADDGERGFGAAGRGRARGGGPLPGVVKRTGKNVFVDVGPENGGGIYRVEVGGAVVGEGKASAQGRLRFKGTSPEGKALLQAQKQGLDVACVPI